MTEDLERARHGRKLLQRLTSHEEPMPILHVPETRTGAGDTESRHDVTCGSVVQLLRDFDASIAVEVSGSVIVTGAPGVCVKKPNVCVPAPPGVFVSPRSPYLRVSGGCGEMTYGAPRRSSPNGGQWTTRSP